METSIRTINGFKVAGILKENIESKDCPGVWDELFNQYTIQELLELGNGISYGVCIDKPGQKGIDYMAAFDLEDEKLAEKKGMDSLEVTDHDYLVLKIIGPVPESIHQGFYYLYSEYFPNSDYKPSDLPSFEVYSDGDMSLEDYEMELWIPVE